MNPLTYVLINIAIVALLYVGSIEINVGGMASGDVIALVKMCIRDRYYTMSAYLLQLFLQKNVLCGFYYPQSTVLITLFYCSFYSALFVPSVPCSLV